MWKMAVIAGRMGDVIGDSGGLEVIEDRDVAYDLECTGHGRSASSSLCALLVTNPGLPRAGNHSVGNAS